jgi:Protein of unknown function (DUF2486)
VHVSDPNDSSIPVLHEILVPGNPAQARNASSGAAVQATQPMVADPDAAKEPVFAPEPSHAPEPVLAPEPVSHAQAESALTHEPAQATEHANPADHAQQRKRPRPHHGADHRHEHGRVLHEPAAEPAAGVFDRAEPQTPIEAGAIVPPDIARDTSARAQPNLDADVIAERLRGRFAGFLTGEGRGIIEARCRDALQDHTSWLVNQITREVALALETELTGWVREAVDQEIARRSGGA